MRHRVSHKHFNRDYKERQSLLKSLVRSLIVEGEITTTVPKAKETKRIADRLIHRAQTDTVATRRWLHRFFGRRDVVNTLVERVAPAMKERQSGFTTVSQVANRRGDNASMATLSLMTKPAITGTLKNPAKKSSTVVKSATKAKPAAAKPAAKPAKVAKSSVAQTSGMKATARATAAKPAAVASARKAPAKKPAAAK